jgi:hypothetical protein
LPTSPTSKIYKTILSYDFRLSFWLTVDVNSVRGRLHGVDVSIVTKVSEGRAVLIFSSKYAGMDSIWVYEGENIRVTETITK